MSYHNGSIWPHDNALIASGFARYDLSEHALTVLDGLFDASVSMDVHRLPELFCGFGRRMGEHPTLYPVACSPQAWASASAFMLLQAVLGLEVNAPQRLVRFTRSRLPAYLDEVRIYGLRVGPVEVDLALRRQDHDVSINVLRRVGHIEIVAIK
jgi:glycogen debranching enzyme